DPNCVPFNFFGLLASPEALDYVIEQNQTLSELEHVVINANVGGSPFEIFGNDVGINVGYEHRRESGSFNPSEFEQQGRGRGASITPIEGSFNVDEVFGELFVPLVTPENDFLVESITAYARGRYVDNTVNGGFFSWAAGGSIAPVPDIEFRGNFTRSFRAPAITELFLPESPAFTFVPDLCFAAAIDGGPNPTARRRNCDAFLAAFPNLSRPQLAAQRSIPSVSGGNPNLENEQADSYSLGVILRPWFAPGLSITTDYVNISISDPIANLTAAQINSGCFDNDDFDVTDPANGNSFCSIIRRDATGEPIADAANPGVRTGFTNGNAIDFEGIQSELQYSTSLEGVGIPGDLALRGSLQVVLRRVIDITGVAPARTDADIGDPTWTGQLAAQYRLDNFGFGTVLNYTGEQLFSRFNRNPDARQFDQLRGFVTADFNVFFETDDDFRFNFVVNNAFGRECQRLNDFCIPGGINDAFGRQFSASVTKAF
ncbi:MAG: TonB-dependent receptor, partial [Pseudomonadota bacterium]